jgi:steroid delta-isomerase-like uncharacterized protein
MGVDKDMWTEFEKQYNTHDWAGVASRYTSDAVFVDPLGRRDGSEGIQAYFEEVSKAFPDLRIETSRLIEEGDSVVSEWTWRATHGGPLAMPDGSEIPATGRTVEAPGVSVFTVQDGKIASQHDYWDNASVMSQLGLMPGA